MTPPSSRDLTRTTLAVLLLGVLISACFWILKPFLAALIWATMIVVATWPLMLAVQARLRGRRPLAVAAMTAALLLLLVVPLSLAIGTIVENADRIAVWSKSLATLSLPAPPDWLARVPAVGPQLAEGWTRLIEAGPGALAGRLSPYAQKLVGWLLARAGSMGVLFVQFLLTLFLSAALYSSGEQSAAAALRLARRIAGAQGENAVRLAAKAIRAVALGVVVTAIIQSALAGIGMAVAGIPYATFLTALIFMLTVAQVGPAPVLIPAVVWLYWSGDTGWASALLVWSILVGGLDNFLRPALIRRGANLPLLLIFAGVIGGLFAFGVIGLFIGPVVLAVSYTLLADWIDDGGAGEAEPEPAAAAERTQPGV